MTSSSVQPPNRLDTSGPNAVAVDPDNPPLTDEEIVRVLRWITGPFPRGTGFRVEVDDAIEAGDVFQLRALFVLRIARDCKQRIEHFGAERTAEFARTLRDPVYHDLPHALCPSCLSSYGWYMETSDRERHQVELHTDGHDLFRRPTPGRRGDFECLIPVSCTCFRCGRSFAPETLRRLICRGEEDLRKRISAGLF